MSGESGAGNGGTGTGAGAGSQGGEGGSAKVENFNTGNGGAPATPDFQTLIPAEYKEKPWVKETKDLPSLFKRTDGLLSELGKRPAGIPAETAPETEWQAFNKAWGVPEKADDYKLSEVPEGMPKNENYTKGIKSVFHKAGVSQRQAAILEKGHNELVQNLLKEAGVETEKNDADFEKLSEEAFGTEKETVLKNAKILVSKFAHPKFADQLANADNKTLVLLASVVEGLRKEYISEDRFPTGGSAPVGMTLEQKQAKGRELMATPAYSDPFHADHEKTVQEVNRLFGTA